MSKSFAQIAVHIVFSTKNRKASLSSQSLRDRLFHYIRKICKNHHCQVLAINGTPDHIHLLIFLARTITISKLIEEIKSSTSKWIKSSDAPIDDFYWQNGYGAFSVSQSNLSRVTRYIADQEEHHRKFTFKDELKRLLKAHNLSYDEEELWS